MNIINALAGIAAAFIIGAFIGAHIMARIASSRIPDFMERMKKK